MGFAAINSVRANAGQGTNSLEGSGPARPQLKPSIFGKVGCAPEKDAGASERHRFVQASHLLGQDSRH